jgi:hypothetical protein
MLLCSGSDVPVVPFTVIYGIRHTDVILLVYIDHTITVVYSLVG